MVAAIKRSLAVTTPLKNLQTFSIILLSIVLTVPMVLSNPRPLLRHLSTQRQTRQATITEDYRWPGGIVPFTIDEQFPQEVRAKINTAIQVFNDRTCVKWVPYDANNNRYVHFAFTQTGKGATNSFCNIGPPTTKTLSLNKLADSGDILHEMMHCIGFLHEHARDDRDDYIKVLYENIPNEFQYEFAKASEALYFHYGAYTNNTLPYDYNSIMHYSKWEYSKDGRQPSMVALKPGVELGRGKTMTDTDVQKVASYYQCVNGKSTVSMDMLYVTFEDPFLRYKVSEIVGNPSFGLTTSEEAEVQETEEAHRHIWIAPDDMFVKLHRFHDESPIASRSEDLSDVTSLVDPSSDAKSTSESSTEAVEPSFLYTDSETSESEQTRLNPDETGLNPDENQTEAESDDNSDADSDK